MKSLNDPEQAKLYEGYKRAEFWRNFRFYCSIGIPVTLFVALFIWWICAVIQEQNEWSAYAEKHCTVVSVVRGDLINTVSFDASGKPSVGIATTPNKTGYLCDDGVTYWR